LELGAVTARDGAAQGLVAGGGSFSIAVRENGSVMTWGTNYGDSMGRDGSNPAPAPVVGLPGPVKAVAAGAWYSVALLRDGRVYAWGWGQNVADATGYYNPNTPTVDKPMRVLTDAGVTFSQISTTYFHVLMLSTDGKVWGFGPSRRGALGVFTDSGFVRVMPLSNIKAVAAGHSHSLALTADGKVMAWGSDEFGQTSAGADTGIPWEVPGLPKIVQIAASSWGSFALDAAGNVWSWGIETTLGRSGARSPARIPGLSGVKAISSGNTAVFATLPNGTVMAWGDNRYGQVGVGSGSGFIATPVKMPVLADVVEVRSAEFHGIATTRNGAIYTWGRNGEKALNGSDNPPQTNAPMLSGAFR
jgi:alpha-tubulin suppressor-like RCC1 family protein